MGEVPGWITEQLQVEGWVVVESLETFDVHLGQRYANRAVAVQKGLSGDALLASRGKAATSGDLAGEFLVGRLRRSAQPIQQAEGELVLVYSLDSVERHSRAPKEPPPAPQLAAPGPGQTHSWTCPSCKGVWLLPQGEPPLPEEEARCPECGEAPNHFSPGQIVRVRRINAAGSRLGVIDEPIQTDYYDPQTKVVAVGGPYTGEYMVWQLREGFGSDAPMDPDVEREIFGSLPLEPERRRRLASHLMMGISAPSERIQALDPEEERQLLGR